jgi:hypothetical protein
MENGSMNADVVVVERRIKATAEIDPRSGTT